MKRQLINCVCDRDQASLRMLPLGQELKDEVELAM